MRYSTAQEAENEQAVPVTIELTDSVPDMVVTPPRTARNHHPGRLQYLT